jgi:putative ABC transport system permease protein
MSMFVAWRILIHEIGRNALAMGGMFIAVLMIFLQLGFYYSVPKGGMMIYNHLRFDLLMTSSAYVVQAQSYSFPRRRLYQAFSQPEVDSVAPFYQAGGAQWLNREAGIRRDVFVMAFKPADKIFAVPEIEQQLDVIQHPDTVLVDAGTLPMYGAQTRGRKVEIGDRTMEIGGRYVLGTGFVGLGVVVTSDQNFLRIFPQYSLGAVNLGLIKLKPGSNADDVARRIREIIPADTMVFTRPEIEAHEIAYWQTRTATGVVFGFGVVVSIVVGMVIVYQTLATQVTRHLPQYATLKAMGYTDSFLHEIVMGLAAIMAIIAFVPALAGALVIYDRVRTITRLPIEMTTERLITVLLLSVAISTVSALIATRTLQRADPADLF